MVDEVSTPWRSRSVFTKNPSRGRVCGFRALDGGSGWGMVRPVSDVMRRREALLPGKTEAAGELGSLGVDESRRVVAQARAGRRRRVE